jgi:hypothetical protein
MLPLNRRRMHVVSMSSMRTALCKMLVKPLCTVSTSIGTEPITKRLHSATSRPRRLVPLTSVTLREESLGYRFLVSKSTYVTPNRGMYPSDHSQLSICASQRVRKSASEVSSLLEVESAAARAMRVSRRVRVHLPVSIRSSSGYPHRRPPPLRGGCPDNPCDLYPD